MFDHVGRTSDPDARARTVQSVGLTSLLGVIAATLVVAATWIFVVEPLALEPEPRQWVEMVELPGDAEPGPPPAASVRKGEATPELSQVVEPLENRAYNVLPSRPRIAGSPRGAGQTPGGSATGTGTGTPLGSGTDGGGGGGPQIVHQSELQVRSRVSPYFPEVAKRIGLTYGRCLATVYIDERGRVSEVTVDQCPAAFHGETIRSLSRWRFQPYRVAGMATPAQTRIAVTYTMK